MFRKYCSCLYHSLQGQNQAPQDCLSEGYAGHISLSNRALVCIPKVTGHEQIVDVQQEQSCWENWCREFTAALINKISNWLDDIDNHSWTQQVIWKNNVCLWGYYARSCMFKGNSKRFPVPMASLQMRIAYAKRSPVNRSLRKPYCRSMSMLFASRYTRSLPLRIDVSEIDQ